MAAGADGYMLKAISIMALVDFLRDFARGDNPSSPYLLDMAVSDEGVEQDPVHITPREHQILELIAVGKSNKQISSEIFLSIETVKTHIKKIFSKLEVKNRLEAVAAARQRKIIE